MASPKPFTFDAENHLTQVTRNGTVTVVESYVYDADGNRVKKTSGSTSFYYPFSHYEISGTTVVKYYAFNGQRVAMKSGSTLTYLHSDHLGSTVLETNASGVVTSDEKYKAYGKQRDTGAVSTDHRFTGQKEDASGLQYYAARYYDPSIGMFVSPDTIVPDAGRVSAYNRTMYARGNPLVYNDPSGHQDVCGGVCPAQSPDLWAAVVSLIVNGLDAPIAPIAAGGAGTMAAGYIAIVWGIQDNGPAYVVPAPYDPGKIQESYPLPGSTTVGIEGTPLTGDGLTTSIPGTTPTNSETTQLPGFTVVQPKPGDNVVTANAPNQIHMDSQGKHIVGHKNYQPGKSILTHSDPQGLLDAYGGTGYGVRGTKGQAGYKEVVDFQQDIGIAVDQAGNATPTTRGVIHYSNRGAHIVPVD